MPTSLLDLPREIRDIIYDHALVSPTGYVMPFSSRRSQPPRFSIYTASDHAEPDHDSVCFSSDDHVLSISLQRTCRQVYQETAGLFWSNSFLFIDPPIAARTIKSMGQISSRQIKSISVSVEPQDWKTLPKLFALLTSRARHGHFEALRLDLQRTVLKVLNLWALMDSPRYDEMLEILRDVSKECNFQRSFRVEKGFLPEEAELDTIRDLHLAFGGRMFYGGQLLWDNYEYVG